jgi:hypothetical protein
MTKGHWPKAKRRNDPGVTPVELRKLLKTLMKFKVHHGYGYRELGEEIGRDQRTLRRWISGEDWPDKRDVLRLRRLTKRAGSPQGLPLKTMKKLWLASSQSPTGR